MLNSGFGNIVIKALSKSVLLLNTITKIEDCGGSLIVRAIPPDDASCDPLKTEIIESLRETYEDHPIFKAIAKVFFGSDGRKNLVLKISPIQKSQKLQFRSASR